jgi:hypothetical protein
MTDNVIVFEPRREVPLELPLEFVELRLGDDCSIQMTLYDQERNVIAALEFTLSFKPQDFDLGLLRAAWDRWRGGSTLAS